jgi:hypothetical protein
LEKLYGKIEEGSFDLTPGIYLQVDHFEEGAGAQ